MPSFEQKNNRDNPPDGAENLVPFYEAHALPETTDQEKTYKAHQLANTIKTLNFSAFDLLGADTPQIPDTETQLRLAHNAVERTWDLADLRDPRENYDRPFVMLAHAWFASALDATAHGLESYPIVDAERMLDSYKAGINHVSDRAIAEAGVSHAGTLAMAGPDFADESAAAARATLAAAERHHQVTGEEILPAGEKYVLGTLLRQNETATEMLLAGGLTPEESRRFISMSNYLCDKSQGTNRES